MQSSGYDPLKYLVPPGAQSKTKKITYLNSPREYFYLFITGLWRTRGYALWLVDLD